MSTPTHEFTLNIWPYNDKENPILISLDPLCLAAVLFLQLTCPGQFALKPCTNLDKTPHGQLPYLTHGTTNISTFESIVDYFARLKRPLDEDLTEKQGAQSIAWRSCIYSHMGTLVSYVLYGNATNFSSFTRTHIASSQSIPARYYVPERLRAVHQIQLEKEGMWEVEAEDHNEDKKRGKRFSISKRDDVTSIEEKNEHIEKSKKKIKQAFGKEKISAKSRSQFDILERLLESNGYLICNRLTTADILLASHLYIILNAPVPKRHIAQILEKKYLLLIKHTNLVIGAATETPIPLPTLHLLNPPLFDFGVLIPMLWSSRAT